MGVSVLGPVEVDGGSSLEPRDRAVLAVLAIRRGQVVSPGEFADALWGGSPPGSWPKQVQICIGRLRRVVGSAAIETTAGGYRLVLEEGDVDATRFESLVEEARVLGASGEPGEAAATLGRALGLWRGAPLQQLDGWPVAQSETARLEELRRTAEDDWLEARLAAGDHRQVAVEAEALVNAEPLRERRWASLALAQYRCARQADALRSLAGARRVLVEQLGLSPGPELVALEQAILRQDPALGSYAEPSAVSGDCPYKGLAPFDERDADSFFGRDDETATCMDRLRAHAFLVVAGPSGCGKSSLVRAGLVPALRACGRRVVVVVPGNDPGATATEIRAITDTTVVVLDQFEELFELGHPPDVIGDLCRSLVARANGGGTVVVAMRSDRLGELGVDAELSELAERGLHLVSPLVGDSLRRAIEQPAQRAGLRLEHGLVELLVRDCEGEPGGLPLLSHALAETWRRRDGVTLTVEGYHGSGGIRGAVARSADRLYDGLGADERATLRSVLLRLVTPSMEGDPVRCRVPARTLLEDARHARIVGLLVRARLVTAEESSFEVAHEALARAWPRLRSWLDDDVAGQRIFRHLTAAADGWESLGRPDAELYRGARLETALEWRDQTTGALTELERAFLDASEDHAGSERRALEARTTRDAATKRRLRQLLMGSAVLLLVALVAGLVAVRQTDRADGQRRLSDVRELAATATAAVDVDPERGALLALAALDRAGSEGGPARRETEQALHRAISELRVERRLTDAGGTVDWSADGRHVLTTGRTTGDVEVREVATGRTVRTFPMTDGGATDVADSPDGRVIAAAGRDGTVQLLDGATGEGRQLVRGAGSVAHLSFSADGTLVAAAWPDDLGGVVRVIETSSGAVLREVAWPGANALTFSPGGTELAVASFSSGAVLSIATGRQLAALDAPLGGLFDVAWSPDGRSIAVAREAGGAQIHDASTGEVVMVLPGHRAQVLSVAWSPDSMLLATASSDGTTKVWALFEGGGRELMTLTADDTRSGFGDVAFSPDGARLVTSTFAGTALIWRTDLDATAEVVSLPGPAFGPGAVRFAADGDHLLTTGGGGGVAVWRPDTWDLERELGNHGNPQPAPFGPPLAAPTDIVRLAPSPDGGLVAAISFDAIVGADGTLPVYDLDGGRDGFEVDVGRRVSDAGWSADGERLAIAGVGADDIATVSVTDRTGELQTSLQFPGQLVETARFTADAEYLVVALSMAGPYVPATGRVEVWDWRRGDLLRSFESDAWSAIPHPTEPLVAIGPRSESSNQDVGIWNLDTGERVAILAGHTGFIDDLVFSHDGTQIATASGDGSVRIWDAATGQEQMTLTGHAGRVYSVSFSPDGRLLASHGAEGTVRVWALGHEQLSDIARQRITRPLTDVECQRYLRISECDLS